MNNIFKIFIICIICIFVTACSKQEVTSDSINVIHATESNSTIGTFHNIYAAEFEYNGHSYLIFEYGQYRAGAVHNPDCKCHNKITENINEN